MASTAAHKLLQRDVERIFRFAERVAKLSGAWQGMNEWSHRRQMWSYQQFLLQASMQSILHACTTICVSLLASENQSTDVNFRRVRQALDDAPFMQNLILERAKVDAATSGASSDIYPIILESYRERFQQQAARLKGVLGEWNKDTLKPLKTFRYKMLAHTTTRSHKVAYGVVHRAEDAVIEAATLAQLLFTSRGVNLEDDRGVAKEHVVAALRRWQPPDR